MDRRSAPSRPHLWRLAGSLCCAAVSACNAAPQANARYTAVAQGNAERGLKLLAHCQCERAAGDLLTPRQRASFDHCALLWWSACLQGGMVVLLPHAVARWMP